MGDIKAELNIPVGFSAYVVAALTKLYQENVIAAATDLMLTTQANAPVDTGHLKRNVHTVYPLQTDPGTAEVESTGLSAGPLNALVIVKTHRIQLKGGTPPRDVGDYAFYQEFGPASVDELEGRHFMLKAIEQVEGKYPFVKIGDIEMV